MSAVRNFTTERRLCDDCEALRFDDAGCGGRLGMLQNNTPVLMVGKDGENFESLMLQHRTDSSPDFPKLAGSAAAGCGLCGFLLAAVLRVNVKTLQTQGTVSIRLHYAWGCRRPGFAPEKAGLLALIAEISDGDGEVAANLCFPIYSRDKATADWLRLYSPPRTEALCPENISFLKHTLESCVSRCHPPAHTFFLPTRLLDVGADAISEPRLVITAESLAGPVRYAALSYCWGNKDDAAAQTKTEPSNLHERLRAIPTSDMSAVMQDAVKVCRALSVRYLWIDALCIIQDPADPSDWERESQQVGQVFQNAYFTICALASASCRQSFLDRRHHITFDFSFQSSLHPPARGTYTLLFTLLFTGPKSTPLDFDAASIDLGSSPWSTRGWVFQEERLSVRKLLFGRYMVHFDCGMLLKVSENGQSSDWTAGVDWSSASMRSGRFQREYVYRGFEWCLSYYAERRLSYESDRLPALSGIAKHVSDLGGGDYLAGLWKEHLYCALLWTRTGLWTRAGPRPSTLADRLAELRASTGFAAPSWSWVSLPDLGYWHGLAGVNVGMAERHLRPEYNSIDGWTVLSGARLNPFGEVKSGTIRVRGKLLPVPAEFVSAAQLRFAYTVWKVYQLGRVMAYCALDWRTSSSRQELGRLQMLLVSSSCSRIESIIHDFFADIYAESWEELGGQNGEGSEKGKEEDEEDNVIEDRDDDGLGQGSISDVGSDGSGDSPFPPIEACVLCNNKELNRNAWGLIIHPAEKPGEYYRMGAFWSPATKVGGTHVFRHVEDQSIDII